MAFMRPKNSNTAQKLNAIRVTTSIYGATIQVGWGTFRCTPNLIDYEDFTALASQSQQSGGGKGGAPKQQGYTYTATLLLGLCFGVVDGVSKIWSDSGGYSGSSALSDAGLNLAAGGFGQAPWGYMVTYHPTKARGYSDLAYLFAQNYALGSSGSVPNLSAEAYRMRANAPSGLQHDANPAAIIPDALGSAIYGVPNWPAGAVADLTDYENYCYAAYLLLSPLLDNQRAARDFIGEVLQASNSDAVWSDGQLRIVPLGDTQITGNGVTWTPDLTAAYDLGPDDFLDAGNGGEPVQRQIKAPALAYNKIKVEFLDRNNDYNAAVTSYQDQGLIDQYGIVENTSPFSLHSITEQQTSDALGPLLLQQSAYVLVTYTFKLPWTFNLLDPLDKVTLTYGNLDHAPVRINKIKENADGSLDVTAEQFLVGIHSAPIYNRQGGSGYIPNSAIPPGSVSAPLAVNPPLSLTSGDIEEWIAVGSSSTTWGGCEIWLSLDNATYKRIAVQQGGARYGNLLAPLPSHPDVDGTNTCSVNLGLCLGVLDPASQAECDGLATLFMVDGELMAYRDCTQIAANEFNLSYLRRGQYGTSPAAHSTGAHFTRLDPEIFKYAYTRDRVGSSIWLKFLSFNIVGGSTQSLADAVAYQVDLAPAPAVPTTPVTPTLDSFVGATMELHTLTVPNADWYVWNIYKADGTTLIKSIKSGAPSLKYSAQQALVDGVQRNYQVSVTAANADGPGPESGKVAASNTAPGFCFNQNATSGATCTVTWTGPSDPDIAGYVLYYSNSGTFDPKTQGTPIYVGPNVSSFVLTGLLDGSYGVRVMAYDLWTSNPAFLNYQGGANTFTISGGGSSAASSAPVGSSNGSTGYAGRSYSGSLP